MENNFVNNLPPFYVGQKVVYVTGHNMTKDSIHEVRECFRESCGCWTIEIGIKAPSIFNPLIHKEIECHCGKVLKATEKSAFSWAAKSFRPLEESPFPSITMKEVVKKECELVSMN